MLQIEKLQCLGCTVTAVAYSIGSAITESHGLAPYNKWSVHRKSDTMRVESLCQFRVEVVEMAHTIITVATMKGGSGKSTVASCLAVYWHLRGRQPTLIDADPQRSIVRIAARERALGGLAIREDATADAPKSAQALVLGSGPVIIDTPGFRSQTTLDCLAVADFVLIPVKASPLDVDRMLDMLSILTDPNSGCTPRFSCILTQTTRDSVIAKHIRAELEEAGFPVLRSEMTNRVAYPEAALWGATPTLIDPRGPAAKEIAVIADEVEFVLGTEKVAA